MISRVRVSPWAFLAGLAIIPAIFAQSEQEKPKRAPASAPTHYLMAFDQAKWTAPPEGMIRGTPSVEGGSPLRYAVVEGDPMKAGAPFTIRLACSDGYKAAPHWHPTDRRVLWLHAAADASLRPVQGRNGLADLWHGTLPNQFHRRRGLRRVKTGGTL
jgi:hypothetical protein